MSEGWWAHLDLNQGPTGYEPAALTTELWARRPGPGARGPGLLHYLLHWRIVSRVETPYRRPMPVGRRTGLSVAVVAVLAVSTAFGDGQTTSRSGARPGAVLSDVAVPMRDGVVLRADVAHPPGSGRWPTLVYRTPYDKRGTSEGVLVRQAVARGYAVVVQDVRGRYASDGVFAAYQQEGADGYDTIEWAAGQAWSNGRVGSFGASYPGAVQWLAAIQSPPHLVAMAPVMTFASPTHFWYTGGVWDRSWLLWTWLNIAPDLRQRSNAPGPSNYEAARAAWKTDGVAARDTLPLAAMPAFKGVADWYYEWMRHPPYDPWWNWAELTDKYDRVSAAVLNVSGWHDEMYGPIGAVTNFAGLVRARGGDATAARTQLVIGPWTHGSDWDETRVGDREMGNAAALDYDTLVLDWMDRWVKGEANAVDRQAPVRLYAMGANAWRTAQSWPPPAERRTLFLGGHPSTARAGTLGVDQAGSERPRVPRIGCRTTRARPARRRRRWPRLPRPQRAARCADLRDRAARG